MIREIDFIKDKTSNVIPLEGIKAMFQIKEMLTAPIAGPAHFAEVVRCWRITMAFGMAAVEDNQYPALSKLWHDLSKRYRSHDNDGILIDSCVFGDFRFGDDNKSLVARLRDKMASEPGMASMCDFLQKLDESRLGLYQVKKSNKKVIRFQEMFTDRNVDAANNIDFCGTGEIFLVRLLPVGDENLILGDPKAFPAAQKDAVQNMVLDKMLMYCLDRKMLKRGEVPSEAEMYEHYMKRAGPYWMSVVLDDRYNAEVLPPDYYKRFLRA